MSHKKETPRQKMIGMMYLVLTALLALNVSREILDAFAIVDKGLVKTTENFSDKNNILYDQFDKLALSNPQKVGPWKDKAIAVRKQANELFNFIQNLKVSIIKAADKKDEAIDTITTKGKKEVDAEKIASKDNTDIPAQIMVGDNNDAEGKVLKKKIVDFREFILGIVNKNDVGVISSIKTNLNTDDPPAKEAGEKVTWESHNFEHLPLIAVTTIMSKMQNDVRNAESEILRYLFNQIDAGSFKFNKLEPTIIANTDYVLRGNEYKAEVFIAAFDTTQRPSIYLGPVKEIRSSTGETDYQIDGPIRDSLPIEKGRGVFRRTGGASGNMSWGGIIQLRATDGSIIRKPFKAQYTVADAGAVISPTKMNVFFLGVDNPVDISVPGVAGNKVYANMSSGVIIKSGNAWVAKVKQLGITTVYVEAEIDGKRKPMGKMEFRVKQIPDPVAKVGNKKGGYMAKNDLAVQNVVVADLEGFDFDARFTVTEFTVSAEVQGFSRDFTSRSNRITEEQRNLIRGLNKGQRVTFTDIKAVGPDGKTRELNGIIIKLQ